MTLEELVAGLADAWNAGDGDRMAALFSDDVVFVDVLGRVQRGPQVIAAEHRKLFETIYRGSWLDVRVESSREFDGTVVALTTSSLDVPDGPRAGITGAVQTVVVRDGRIVAYQNTIRTDPARFADDDADLAEQAPLNWQGVTDW